MFLKYLLVFLIAMLPIIELRGAIPVAMGMKLDYFTVLAVCIVGNMFPVPFIYYFARKFLTWGSRKKYIGKACNFFLTKGEKAGQKLTDSAGRWGMFVALMLFVGIPLPGTGAWTGTMAASFLNMGFKTTVVSVSLGVLIAGIIVAVASTGVFNLIGF